MGETMLVNVSLRLAAASASLALALGTASAGAGRASSAIGPRAEALPRWLTARPGTTARVDIAPWLDSDEPEAALTASPASLGRDFSADASRPPDIVYEPVGVRVRIERVLAGRIVRVRGIDAPWVAYAPLARLVPEIPAGTRLRTAGGFGGFADFYPTLPTPQRAAQQLATGTPLVALGMDAAPYDPGTSDLVRVRVRIAAGERRGTVGWLPVGYTGLPAAATPKTASVAEHACRCRLAAFDDAP